ncbi:2-dehydropantoate 2-reductase [Alkalicoccobacillus murimartini]|uniref:2-dehydropantoate 2-reductase n=1 Tax=Alkalicoccobacillus murimartini TaxID=171685 RepID=A0ABT9YFG2_9BACI|nr:2-dehydropantoate 2-reductase [Alkalicoccobacillus murimartini]MDQ0206456.1 2-dehydropantoate 2-reductase [Alkalicoccobacillus murimartini]
MKSMIIGGGSIGLLMAAYIHQAGVDVCLCTRTSKQADALNADGVTLHAEGITKNMSIHSIQLDQAPIEEADMLVFAVKSYDLHTVMKQIAPKLKQHQVLLFLQNGMTHVEEASQLENPSIGIGTLSHGALRESATVVRHTGVGELRWANYHKSSSFLTEMMTQMNQEDFVVKEENSWQEVLWSKLLVNVCINPLTALTGVKNGDILASVELKQMMRNVFEEAIQLHPRNPDYIIQWEKVLQVCKQTSQNQSSMLVDLRNKRRTERDSILGYLVRLAQSRNVSIPFIQFLDQAIREREHNF